MNTTNEQYEFTLEETIKALAEHIVQLTAQNAETQLKLSLFEQAAERANSLANVRVPADYAPAQSDANTGFIL